MCATSGGRNQVDVTLTNRLPLFSESDTPRCTLALRKAVTRTVRKTLTIEQRDHGVSLDVLSQVVTQTTFVLPLLGFTIFFVLKGDDNTGHEHGF